jgi:HK97 family phage prohead protease
MKKDNNNINIEIRHYSNSTISIRNNDNENESRTVEGYAIVFDTFSEDLGFTEIIKPEALSEDVLKRSDIFFLLNHNESRGILARYKKGKGTLKLEIDNKGLRYEFEAPKTDLGNELLEMLQRGDLDSSSFSFSTPSDGSGEIWEEGTDGKYLRTIIKFDRLFDCSAVFQPAYEATTCENKRFLEFQEKQQNEVKLQNYFNLLEKQIKQ